MSSQGTEVAQLFRSFEDCRFEFEGTEAWRARDLMPLLGYTQWRNFREAVRKAWESCKTSGVEPALNFLIGDGSQPWSPEEVFADARKNPEGGRPSEDVILTRRAAYLVAMNGDPRKAEIAFAQHYFAVATRTLEVIEQRLAETARLQAREKLTETEKKFQGVLYEHDVDGPGIARIRSKGDAVLFGGNDTEAMKAKWNVPAKRALADFAPEVVVVGKQFATAITTHNVKTNKIKGETAITSEHLANNRTVRKTLGERGIVPEELAPEEDIKKVERRHSAEARKVEQPRGPSKKR
jgi:DNA-damage-inducible protein D